MDSAPMLLTSGRVMLMARVAGIPLIDLFDIADTVNSVLPQAIRDFIERFVIADYDSHASDGAIIHSGALQALSVGIEEIPTEFDIGIGRLSIPLIQTGIPFQLAFERSAIAGNLEGNADIWRLDLTLDVINLLVDGLQPGKELLDSEIAEGRAALELGDVQGHCGAWQVG